MSITDRYASAVHSKNLDVDERTSMSDTDVLGAYGLASRENALAITLSRLLAGDNRVAPEVVCIMGKMAWKKSRAYRDLKLTELEAQDMAKQCLAWWRNGRCNSCGGIGKTLIPGTKTLSDRDCPNCHGTGMIPFEKNFRREKRELALWLVTEVERSLAFAGPLAMIKLSAKMEV